MYIKQIYKYLSLFFAALLVFTSCMVETAKPDRKQTVIIYSDCLGKNDVALFKKFRKKEHIRVRIVHLPADSIITRIKRDGFNTTADIIILKSLFDIQKAQKAHLFQPVNSWKMDELVNERYKSPENKWFGIGINPSVLLAKHDTLAHITELGELLYTKNKGEWSTNLETPSELVPVIAPALQKKKRSVAIEWYMDFLENDHTGEKETDKNGIPVMTANMLLTYYSSYAEMSKRNDSTDFQLRLAFTNQKKKGAFYNLVCAGVVKQARNYENAKLLIEYITTIHMNEKINNRWNTFPISLHERIHPYAYQNTPFKLFKGSCYKLMINYPTINRIVIKKRRREVIND